MRRDLGGFSRRLPRICGRFDAESDAVAFPRKVAGHSDTDGCTDIIALIIAIAIADADPHGDTDTDADTEPDAGYRRTQSVVAVVRSCRLAIREERRDLRNALRRDVDDDGHVLRHRDGFVRRERFVFSYADRGRNVQRHGFGRERSAHRPSRHGHDFVGDGAIEMESMKRVKNVVALAGLAIIAGCSSNVAMPAIPPSAGGAPAAASKTGASFVFSIPTRANASGVRPLSLRPNHLTLNVQSLTVNVRYGTGATTGTPGAIVNAQTIDPATDPTRCSAVSTVVTCTVSVALVPDGYTVDIASYDAPNAGGNLISQATGKPFVVAANVVNNVPVTLVGVPHSIVAVPDASSPLSGHIVQIAGQNTSQIAGTIPVPITVYGVDADGNTITVGQPTLSNVTASSNNSSVIVVGTPAGQTFTARSASLGARTTITATADYNGTTYTTFLNLVPVEELFVGGAARIDGYGMFSGGVADIDTIAFPSGSNLAVRAVAKQSLLAFDYTNGSFYSVVPGSMPVFTLNKRAFAGARDFAVSPDGLSYFASISSGVIQVTASSGTVLRTYGLSNPSQLDFDASGNLYAALLSGSIAQLPLGSVTGFNSAYITGLNNPTTLGVGNAANGGLLYEGDHGSGVVHIFNGTTNTGVGGQQSGAFAFDAAGEAVMLNRFVSPATLDFYAPNSSTPLAGRSYTIPAGNGTNRMDFVI